MSLQSGRLMLQDALKELLTSWAATEDEWRDSKRRQFRDDHVAPLEPTVNMAIDAGEHLAKLIAKAKHDCE
ncbi:MAG: hypothetical protein HN742_33290 [Lentisphaerae bacterium]|jgi:hypothetical protein|nr:hypothetical protein [Lentisphaerota bacterium]MBT4816304.1 hypothetical protein [Lentisphaerota bacterium]MBT5606555.1 hypothetical protein [Lentisphaerota bacterium]MBT7053464.1 hypothetical protein [Lentisphaerota bacterium]MBT7846793.1 hypothetical protein [Lentisphaerota bacterium]